MPRATGILPERLRGALGLTLVAGTMTLAMAAPVLVAPSSRLFGDEIVGRHEAPFIVAEHFENPRPFGLYTQPVTDYLGAAIAALTGDGIAALNLLTLATFPLAALFAYLLAHRLTGSRPAAWLAGLLYGFAPFHVAQSAYHPHGAQTQWIPLFLLALWLCLERAALSRLVLLATSAGLVALSNYYYGLFTGIITPFALLGFWQAQRRSSGRRPAGARWTVLALGAVATAGVIYLIALAPAVFERREQLAFPRSDLALYGARWSSYVTPPVGNPVFGSWVREAWERRGPGGMLEQQVSVGFGLLLLAGLALIVFWKGDRRGELAAAPALGLIAAVAFAFSLAPTAGGLALSAAIHQALPMFRAYARFSVLVFLAVAILASVGVTRFLRAGGRQRWIGVGLLTVTIAELTPMPPLRWRDVLPTTAHRYLAESSGPIRLLDCAPQDRLAENPAFQRFEHPLSLPAGNADCGDPDLAVAAATKGFTHLLVRRPSPLAEWLTARPSAIDGSPEGRFDDALLFRLRPPDPRRAYFEFEWGFHWREYRGEATYRWMGPSGALAIVNSTEAAVPVASALKLHAFPESRSLSVSFGGRPLTELLVTTEPADYPLPEISVPPGRHLLTLRPTSPAVVADSVLHNGDFRELTIAVWTWIAKEREPDSGI